MTESAGALLRDWRHRRRVTQLELAHRAGVSARHVSFIETDRSRPTSAMLRRLCDQLDVPLREQNRLLLACGHAPAHPEHQLTDPSMAQVSEAIEAVLTAHMPYPALVIDRGWDLVAANDAVYALLSGVAVELREPPVNVVRLSLHPDGLAPRIVNLPEWREHLLHRLHRDHERSADPRLATLLDEFGPRQPIEANSPGLVVSMRLRTGDSVLSLISTTTVFGTPREVTVSELAIEAFYPADMATRHLVTSAGGSG